MCSVQTTQSSPNTADESLEDNERKAWEIAAQFDWSDLLPESGGIQISDTSLRAISLNQLHEIIKHVPSGIEGG